MYKKIFWGICIAILVYLIYSFIIAFFKLNPHLNTIFEKGVQLEHEQKLTDSIITFTDEFDKTINLNLLHTEENTFHFWSSKNHSSLDEISALNQHSEKNFYVLTNDSIHLVNEIKTKEKIKFTIYHYETDNLPFKHKNIDILPYTITIKKGMVKKAYFGEIKK